MGRRIAIALWSIGLLALAPATAGSARTVAYCPFKGSAGMFWGFHVGAPISGTHGSYAHGHGTYSAGRATGVVCEVDRFRRAGDRQVQLSVTHGAATLERGVTVGGVLGAQLRVPVTVAASTDPTCRVHSHGTLTLFTSYNGAHMDSVHFSFGKTCSRHSHAFRGSNVVVAIPH